MGIEALPPTNPMRPWLFNQEMPPVEGVSNQNQHGQPLLPRNHHRTLLCFLPHLNLAPRWLHSRNLPHFRRTKFKNHSEQIDPFERVGNFMQKCVFSVLSIGPIASHITFIMDENRRFAHNRNMADVAGHHFVFLNVHANILPRARCKMCNGVYFQHQ
ncbi:hypothetical protein LguiA_014764 [Lonicera macranthoides]